MPSIAPPPLHTYTFESCSETNPHAAATSSIENKQALHTAPTMPQDDDHHHNDGGGGNAVAAEVAAIEEAMAQNRIAMGFCEDDHDGLWIELKYSGVDRRWVVSRNRAYQGTQQHAFYTWVPVPNREYVVKVVRRGKKRNFQLLNREIRVLRALEAGCGVAKLVSHGNMQDGTPFLVTEMCGTDLFDTCIERSKSRGSAPWFTDDEIMQIAEQLTRHLHALHEQEANQVAHMDVKPENVVWVQGKGGRATVRLIDMGLALPLSEGEWPAMGDQVGGTAANIPPEVWRYNGVTDARGAKAVDAWQTGLVLYLLLVNRPMSFKGKRWMDMVIGTPSHWNSNVLQTCMPAHLREVVRCPHFEKYERRATWERLLKGLLHTDPDERMTCGQAHAILIAGRGGGGKSAKRKRDEAGCCDEDARQHKATKSEFQQSEELRRGALHPLSTTAKRCISCG